MRSIPSRVPAPRTDSLDDDGGGLLPALVAAGRLTGFERSDEPADERAERLLERARHLVDDGLAGEDVPLHREAGAGPVPCPVEAGRAGERRRAAVGGHDPELARLPLGIVGEHAGERVVRLGARGELLERALAVDGHAGGLRGDRSDARGCPRDDRADGEVLRLHRAPHLACLEVGRDDREGSACQHQWWWRSRYARTFSRLPQLFIEHQARERFLAVSMNAQRQSSARHAFIRSHVPSAIPARDLGDDAPDARRARRPPRARAETRRRQSERRPARAVQRRRAPRSQPRRPPRARSARPASRGSPRARGSPRRAPRARPARRARPGRGRRASVRARRASRAPP